MTDKEEFPKKPKIKFSLGINFDILVNDFKLNLENKSTFQYDVAIRNEKNEEKESNKLVII